MRTRRGYWVIRRPLGWETRVFLEKVAGTWPFKGNEEVEGETEIDFAEILTEAQLREEALGAFISDPELLNPEQRAAYSKIQASIFERAIAGTSLLPCTVPGSLYQLWLQDRRIPTVSELAKQVGISRTKLYQEGFSMKRIREIYHNVCEPIRTDLPGL